MRTPKFKLILSSIGFALILFSIKAIEAQVFGNNRGSLLPDQYSKSSNQNWHNRGFLSFEKMRRRVQRKLATEVKCVRISELDPMMNWTPMGSPASHPLEYSRMESYPVDSLAGHSRSDRRFFFKAPNGFHPSDIVLDHLESLSFQEVAFPGEMQDPSSKQEILEAVGYPPKTDSSADIEFRFNKRSFRFYHLVQLNCPTNRAHPFCINSVNSNPINGNSGSKNSYQLSISPALIPEIFHKQTLELWVEVNSNSSMKLLTMNGDLDNQNFQLPNANDVITRAWLLAAPVNTVDIGKVVVAPKSIPQISFASWDGKPFKFVGIFDTRQNKAYSADGSSLKNFSMPFDANELTRFENVGYYSIFQLNPLMERQAMEYTADIIFPKWPKDLLNNQQFYNTFEHLAGDYGKTADSEFLDRYGDEFVAIPLNLGMPAGKSMHFAFHFGVQFQKVVGTPQIVGKFNFKTGRSEGQKLVFKISTSPYFVKGVKSPIGITSNICLWYPMASSNALYRMKVTGYDKKKNLTVPINFDLSYNLQTGSNNNVWLMEDPFGELPNQQTVPVQWSSGLEGGSSASANQFTNSWKLPGTNSIVKPGYGKLKATYDQWFYTSTSNAELQDLTLEKQKIQQLTYPGFTVNIRHH